MLAIKIGEKATVKPKLLQDLPNGSLVIFPSTPDSVYMKCKYAGNTLLTCLNTGRIMNSWTNTWDEVDGELTV